VTIDRAERDRILVVPHFSAKLLSRDDSSFLFDEVLKELKFSRGERDALPISEARPCRKVDCEVVCGVHVRPVGSPRCQLSAENRLHASIQLFHRKRLHDVVIDGRSGVLNQTTEPVRICHHQEGGVDRQFFCPFEQIAFVRVRKRKVEKCHVVSGRLGQVGQCCIGVPCRCCFVPWAEVVEQGGAEPLVVFDD
jgi:hypothetical protein